MNFGENLKKMRKSKKMSQEDLAEKINVSRQSISKWETGDAYPEMNNLLELCKTFHCKINDLVNDSIIDIDSLDDEIKDEVISLKKEEQHKMKTLSKIIAIIANIGKIGCYIAIPFIILIMISTIFLFKNIDIVDNKIIWTGDKDSFSIQYNDDKLKLQFNDLVIADESIDVVNTKYLDVLNNNSPTMIVIYLEVSFLVLLITVYITSEILKHLKHLFDNLYDGETPFTLENVNHIKSIAWQMIIVILLPNIGGLLSEMILSSNLNIDFESFSLIEILFLFSLSYVFEYGRLIQLESNGNIYGEINE